MMLEEKGVLPIGIEYEGEIHRAFTIRPLKMRDSVEARSSEDLDRLTANSEHMGLYLIGRRLKIEGVPEEAKTIDFMLDLWDEDVSEILAADERLANAIEKFCRSTSDGPGTCSGVDEGGVRLSGSNGNGEAGGHSLAGIMDKAQDSEGAQGKDVQGPEAGEVRP